MLILQSLVTLREKFFFVFCFFPKFRRLKSSGFLNSICFPDGLGLHTLISSKGKQSGKSLLCYNTCSDQVNSLL